MDKLLFSAASILSLLAQVEEFKDFNIGITETLDGKIQLQVDDSVYELIPDESTAVDAPVEDEVIEDVETAQEEAYQDLASEGIEIDTPIESGLIKEALKTIALGGMVRLGAKWLKD